MIKQRMEHLTDEELEDLICELEAAGFYRRQLIGLTELQERRKAGDICDLFLRAKQLMYQSGGAPIENSLNPIDAWLYDAEHAAPQPASERERVRREHAEWSDFTFGDVGPVGPLKHLSKEALEAAANPEDPLEWADMQFLLWDAQRRMGISDDFITRAMIEKLAINKSRQWPEPKDGEPRLHIKEQPVPVIPDEIEPDRNNTYDYVDGWNACRAAMLQGEPQNAQQNIPKNIPAGNSPVIGIDLASGPDRTVEVRYFSLPGYSVVPIAPTQEMAVAGGDTYVRSEDVNQYPTDAARRIWAAMVAAAPMQEVKKTPIAKEIAMGARLTDHRFKI